MPSPPISENVLGSRGLRSDVQTGGADDVEERDVDSCVMAQLRGFSTLWGTDYRGAPPPSEEVQVPPDGFIRQFLFYRISQPPADEKAQSKNCRGARHVHHSSERSTTTFATTSIMMIIILRHTNIDNKRKVTK